MNDGPKELRPHGHVYGNWRVKSPKHVSASKRREGNSAEHLAIIRLLPCCVPGCSHPAPNDPHHLKSEGAKKERSVGRRATDRFAVPLCRLHHDSLERLPSTKEIEQFLDWGIEDIHALAEALWNAPKTVDAKTRIVWAHKFGVNDAGR